MQNRVPGTEPGAEPVPITEPGAEPVPITELLSLTETKDNNQSHSGLWILNSGLRTDDT